MPVYETVYILRPDLSTAQVEQISQGYIKLLKQDLDSKATIGREEYWGLRSLAYRMRKQRKGHYLLINYDGASALVQEFERRMRLSEDVLRYLTVKLDAMPSEPSPMMRQSDEGDERPEGRKPRTPRTAADDAETDSSHERPEGRKPRTPRTVADDAETDSSLERPEGRKPRTPRTVADDAETDSSLEAADSDEAAAGESAETQAAEEQTDDESKGE